MNNSRLGIVRIKRIGLLVPVKRGCDVQGGVRKSRRSNWLTATDRAVLVFYSLNSATRVGHFNPAIRAVRACGEMRGAVWRRQRVDEVCARLIRKLRLDADWIGDHGQLPICIGKCGEPPKRIC